MHQKWGIMYWKSVQVYSGLRLDHSINQRTLGEISLYGWPPVWLVWIHLFRWIETKQICLFGQILTGQTGGQPYSDISPYKVMFSVPTVLIKHLPDNSRYSRLGDHFSSGLVNSLEFNLAIGFVISRQRFGTPPVESKIDYLYRLKITQHKM